MKDLVTEIGNKSRMLDVAIAELKKSGLLANEKNQWRLTEKGLKLSNQAFVKFLP